MSVNINNINQNQLNNITHNFLRCRKWEFDNDDQQINIENKFEKIGKKLDQNKLKDLKEDIEKINLDQIFDDNFNLMIDEPTLNMLNNLDFLIEDTYSLHPVEDEIKQSDKAFLSPYIYKFRKMKNDGNSFYRGIIFFFFENIILSENIKLMKEFLNLFDQKMSENNPKIQKIEYLRENIKEVNREIIISILYILIKSMEKRDGKEIYDIYDELSDYKILLKVFLKSKEFDYGIIFFTRYLIYEFISENENKTISKEINFKLGYLLSNNNSEENGKIQFLFEDYYKKLMTMNENNENIDLYIVPYVFKCDISIIKYNYGDEFNSVKKCVRKCGKSTTLEITLLLRDNHYDIVYEEYYYKRNYKIMDIFIEEKKFSIVNKNIRHNSFRPNTIEDKNKYSIELKDNNLLPINKSLKDKNSINIIKNSNLPKCLQCKNIYEHKENLFGLCKNCLKTELKTKILLVYFEFLKKGYTKNYEKKFYNLISKTKICISMQNHIDLNIAIRNSGFKFKDLFLEIKQSMCLYCGKSIENDKYYLELPCKCKICDKNCFKKYMEIVDDKNKIVLLDKKDDIVYIVPMTECQCGFEYNLNAFLQLINEMRKRNEKSYKKIYEEQVKNNWKWICMVCRQNFHKSLNYFRLFLTDKKIDKKLLNKFELKHLICEICFKDNNIKETSKISCNFCKSEHIIDFIKKVDSENKTESACMII